MITNSQLQVAHSATAVLYNLNLKEKQTKHLEQWIENRMLDTALTSEEKEKLNNAKEDCKKMYAIIEDGRKQLKNVLEQHGHSSAYPVAQVMQDFMPYF